MCRHRSVNFDLCRLSFAPATNTKDNETNDTWTIAAFFIILQSK